MSLVSRWASLPALLLCVTSVAAAADGLDKTGNPELKSAGPLAFGPKGVLFVGDPIGGQIVAIALPAGESTAIGADFKMENLAEKLGGVLGIPGTDVRIRDVAVDPATKVAYIGCARGQAPTAEAAIVTVDGKGNLKVLATDKVQYAKIALTNVPDPNAPGKGKGGSPRQQAITDLAYVDGKLFIAGLSNEEFASKLRSVEFPFKAADTGASVEIFHTAHNAVETRSPVQTFVPFIVGGQPQILAAYTCTPLVTFPVADLKVGTKIRGKTVAELGSGNQPIDMIAYEQGGKQYLLLSNSSRGVMKITTQEIEKQNLTTAVGREQLKAGLTYDTIANLEGTTQLDKLGTDRALVLTKGTLQAVALP